MRAGHGTPARVPGVQTSCRRIEGSGKQLPPSTQAATSAFAGAQLSEPDHTHGRERGRDYKQRLRVGQYQVDAGALVVRAPQGESTRLKPKAMAVLLELARQPGITVPREELLDRVWERSYVTPGVLAHAITALRRAFGDNPEQPTYIETIPRIGYRLIAPVESLPAAAPDPEPGAARSAQAGSAERPAIATTAAQGDAQPSRRRPRWRLAAAAGTGLLVAAALFSTWWFAERSAAPKGTGIVVADVRRVSFAPGSEDTPRLNAAGDWLVYSGRAGLGARPRLMLQSAYGTQAAILAEGEHAERPVWSPQGRKVAYVWRDGDRCEIRIWELVASTRQTVASCPTGSIVYLDWNPADPGLIAYTALRPGQRSGARLQLLRDQGGWRPVSFEYQRDPESIDLYPRFSPDGRNIAFRRSTNPTSDLYLVPAVGGEVTRLTRVRAEVAGFDWLPDGSGLVFSSDHAGTRALYLLSLPQGAVSELGIADAVSPDIAARGWRMSFSQQRWRSSLATLAVEDGAGPQLLAPSSGRDQAGTVAPDGARAVFVSDRDGSSQLWSLDLASGRTRRLTEHVDARVERPAIAPDGRSVLYVLRSRGRYELWEYGFGDDAGRRVATMPASVRNAIYGGDGRSIWYVGWQGTRWALHHCARATRLNACDAEQTPLSALRVEHARIDGRDLLVLAPTEAAGGLRVVTERGLRPLRRLPLPNWEAWTVVDDAIWYLRDTGDDDHSSVALYSTSLRDASVRRHADYPGLEPLPHTPFGVTPDRRRLILPVMTENSSDIGVAPLVKAAP